MGELVRAILMVDDDERLLATCKRSLMQHRVYAVSDPALALQIARQQKPDLSIVDLRIGRISGLELVRQLKHDRPDMLVALISGFLSVESGVAAIRAGADVVLAKPITPKEILRRIEGRSCVPDPDISTPTLAQAEREHIERVVADCNGNVSE